MRPYRHMADFGCVGLWRGVVRAAAALALMTTLSGCLLDADKPDIAIDVPKDYKFTTSKDPEAALPSLDWWEGFRSAELTQLMREAQTANLDIAIAISQILQADAQVRITGAGLLPLIDYNASDQATKMSQQLGTGAGSTRGGAGGVSPYSRLYTTSLSASYIVDFWGKNQAAFKATVETAEASRFNKEVVALTALASVANTYFSVLEAQDRLRIARRNLTDATRILDLIKQQFAAGTSSDLNVAQQESLVEQVRATIPIFEQLRLQSIVALAVLVGRTPERFSVKGSSLTAITTPRITPGLPSSILFQRPDMRQVEYQLRSSTYSVESARAAFFPTIQLTGTLGYQSAALRTLLGPGCLGLYRGGEPHPADLRRRRADGSARAAERPAGPISPDLSQNGALGLFERRTVVDRRSADDRSGDDPGESGAQLPPRFRSVGTAAQGGHDQSRDADPDRGDAVHRRRRARRRSVQSHAGRRQPVPGAGWRLAAGAARQREPRSRDPFAAFWVPLD